MTEFRNQHERDAAARALMAPNQPQAQQPTQPSWANWFANRFTAENAMNIPYNAYAIGSNAIGAGIDATRYFLDPKTAPHPTQRQTDPAASRAAFDAAGLAATGGIAATTAATAARIPMVPKGAVGSNAVPAWKKQGLPDPPSAKDISNKWRVVDDHEQISLELPNFYVPSKPHRNSYVGADGAHLLDAYKMTYANVDHLLEGTGYGSAMYREIIRRSFARDRDLISDDSVSDAAARIYNSLAKDGYDVRRNPDAVHDRGMWFAPEVERNIDGNRFNSSHVFRVVRPNSPKSKSKEFFSSGIPGLHATEDEQ